MTNAEIPGAGYLLSGLLVMLAVTLLLRAAPFVALARLRDSEFVRYLGMTMPAGVMVVLVVYTLRDTTGELGSWLPAAVALGLTIAAHLLLKRAALSIVIGTAIFVLLTAVL